ncbi:MAG: glycosyltransferase [Phenylobacterium sp.]|nr:glycosyltransferase [Phenylobacterium sp.]
MTPATRGETVPLRQLTAAAGPALSVVAPCYNEQETLPAFVGRMVEACRAVAGESFELLLVNDGSRDGTWPLILQLAETNPGVIGVSLARNYGHQLAVTAGLKLARGERVLVIDADLQDPPELLVELSARMDEGYDVVYAQRRSRAKESPFKLVTADLFYRLLGGMSEVPIPHNVGDFRLMSRRAVDRLNAMPEQDRFLRGMVAWMGGRQTEVLYDRDPRYAGETGYTLKKMIKLATAGITSFSTVPLKLAVVLAAAGAAIAFGLLLYVVVGFVTGHVARGWTSLAMMMVFFGVGQFLCLAVMGAYIGRIFLEVKARPLYFIDDVVRGTQAAPASGAREAQR